MIVTEIIAVDPDALAHGAIVTGYDPDNESGFKQAAEAVEGQGACLLGQLWHPGRQQLWSPVISPKGVSDQPDALSWTVPHVMSTDDVRRVVDAYVGVAERLQRCGFGGVELHGAHGYLITQFLSPWSNTRGDAYGGSLEGRILFPREIAQAIRESCGADFVIGLKMPGDEGVEGGIDPTESARITAALSAYKVFDYFAYNQGNFSLSLENHVPDMHFRRAHFFDLYRGIKPSANVPIMGIGRIAMPEDAEAMLATNACDLVGISRALIADAEWPNKARAGRVSDIRPSTFDNIAWGEIHAGKPLEEIHNPELGHKGEAGWAPPPAAEPKRVIVVGAGPAGIQAAWIAAARGHQVTLIGASDEIGGKLKTEAALPGGHEYERLLAWMKRQLDRHGVEQRLGTRIAADDVFAVKPDVAILATGSRQRTPMGFSGSGLSVRDWAARRADEGKGRTAVLFDMDHGAATYAAAELLAQRFNRVVLMTPRTQIARNVNYCSAIGVHRRLYEADVQFEFAAEPVSLDGDVLSWRNVYTGRVRTLAEVDLLVWSTPRIADDELDPELRRYGIAVHLVGDAMSPRNILSAIHEGHAAGLAV